MVPWCGHWGRLSTLQRYGKHQMFTWKTSTTFWELGIKSFCPFQVIRVYIGSFWSHPLLIPDNRKLFEAEEQDLFKDIQSLPRNAALRKLNDLIKRARLAKVGSGRTTKTLGWRLGPLLYYRTYVKLIRLDGLTVFSQRPIQLLPSTAEVRLCPTVAQRTHTHMHSFL